MSLNELYREIRRGTRAQAFRDGYMGYEFGLVRYLGDYNINSINAGEYSKWYWLGDKWRRREVNRLRWLGAVTEAYHSRGPAPTNLEWHRRACTQGYVYVYKRRVKTGRRFA